MKKTVLTLCLCLVGLLVLTSCAKSSVQTDVTYGPLSATGTLIKAELSLTRRGTHLLLVQGKRTYFVESRTVNLSEFEGREIVISGTLEKNTSKEHLPVLIASTIQASLGDSDLHIWDIPALNLSIKAPKIWTGTIEKRVAAFRLPGEVLPILTVQLLSGSSLPQGSSFYVQNRRATRVKSGASGVQEIYILERDSIVSLTFDPTKQETLLTLDETRALEGEFELLLSQLKFLSESKFTGGTSDNGADVPCGGGTGMLCETGFYCAIQDVETQAGVCRKLK